MVGRFRVLINEDSGTVRSIGKEALEQRLQDRIDAASLDADLRFVPGKALDGELRSACSSGDCELVMVGGGDGTLSSAARILSAAEMPMGVMPLGTMNLFARSLDIPADPEEALMVAQTGRIAACDLGEVNERRFTHHVTLGLHPHLARLRERMNYASKLQKIIAAVRAYLMAIRRAPLYHVDLKGDGTTRQISASVLIVSNNQLGEGMGHLPYADELDKGVLGVYHCASRSSIDLLSLTAAALAGQWRDNPQLEATTMKEVEISLRKKRALVSIDGEIVKLEPPLVIRTVPKALKILVPSVPG